MNKIIGKDVSPHVPSLSAKKFVQKVISGLNEAEVADARIQRPLEAELTGRLGRFLWN